MRIPTRRRCRHACLSWPFVDFGVDPLEKHATRASQHLSAINEKRVNFAMPNNMRQRISDRGNAQRCLATCLEKPFHMPSCVLCDTSLNTHCAVAQTTCNKRFDRAAALAVLCGPMIEAKERVGAPHDLQRWRRGGHQMMLDNSNSHGLGSGTPAQRRHYHVTD